MDAAQIERNLDHLRERIHAACVRSGRNEADVQLVAVTKRVGPDAVKILADLGVRDIGENRVQEGQRKQEALGGTLGLRWHMIGHVQTNKAGQVVERFDLVHGVDSVRVAEALDRRAAAAGKTMPILIQCNTSGEASKFGISPDELGPLLGAILPLENIRLDGLMTMAPFEVEAEETRPCFGALRELAGVARRAAGLSMPELSMGMTHDYEVAVEEGATLIRVGTALFS